MLEVGCGTGRILLPIARAGCTVAGLDASGHDLEALPGIGKKLSADEIRQWITDAKAMTAKTHATRKPEMKQYTLPKDDVDALVAYLSTLKGK